ncbi:MAG: PSD1 and planctomycete cytochrome C domain-containing protein [Bryobacterales bacterium]
MDKRVPALLFLFAAVGSAAPEPVNGVDLFETKVRPVLADNCYACHTQTKLGGLRLDSRAAILEGGKSGPAIVPGKPGESLLIKVIRHEIEDMKMPMGGKLADDQIASLTTWVEQGAPWPEEPDAIITKAADGFQITPAQRNFWSFQPLAKTQPPQLRDKRIHNYIDNYVFAKLQAEGLEANPLADKRTLIRRASMDLTGLPPTPKEVKEFINDKSPDAYAKLVDRLLASPKYGERWGRHWLDVVRFGEDDLHGIAKNRMGYEPYPKAYLYRDWVVKAFNDDMPYDTFVKAQLAADLMGKTEWEDKPKGKYGEEEKWGRLQVSGWDEMTDEERRAVIPAGHIVDDSLNKELLPGLGFQGAGPWYYDLGDAWVMRADERNDRVDVVTRGFLGLTVACARCHDHKYDPISNKDYYALAGVFFNSPYHEYPLVEQAVVDHWRAKNEIVKAQQKRIRDFLSDEAKQISRQLAYQTRDYMVAAWEVTGEPKKDVVGAAYDHKLDVEILQRWIEFLAKPPNNYPYLMEWQSLVKQGGNLEAAETQAAMFQDKLLAIMDEYEENKERNDKIETKAWPLDGKPPIPMPNEFETSFQKYYIEVEPMERVRANLYMDVFLFDLDAQKKADGSPGRKPGLLSVKDWGLESRLTASAQAHLERMKADLKKLEKERGEQYPFVMGVKDSPTITELPLHKRGSPLDLGEPVERRFLQVLDPKDQNKLFTKGSGRLELAEAIVKHPLAARVIVNRVWKWHFGTGLVNTPSNFGQVGERPSHPDLLEYLAQRFLDSGMSIKQLHRDIMLSYVYRESGDPNEAAMAKDPQDRLYWRFGRQRLDAEQIRDSLLFVSGLLKDEKVGGPSKDIDNPEFHRRALYGKVSRFQLADYHATFDFPNPGISASQRFVTSVPLQRLFFMNSELVYDAASKLVERASKPAEAEAKAKEAKGDKKGKKGAKDETAEKAPPVKLTEEQKIARAYELLFQRDPTTDEVQAGLAFLSDEKNQKADDDYRDKPVTAWNLYARALLSSNEFLFMN